MRMWLAKSSIVMLGFALCAMLLTGCPGNDNDDDNTSTIQGNVSQVAVALQEQTPDSRFASLTEFFTLVRTAHAQSSSLEGIIIEALLNGQVIDTTITDGAGNFVLEVIAGTLTLTFEVDGVKMTIEVVVPLQTMVKLGVSIDVPEENVEVEQLDYEVGETIRCTNGDVMIPEGGHFEIQGNGDACIFASGNCSVEIHASSVKLNGCEACVQALGSGSVSIIATEEIECEATETGLSAGGNATVSMTALPDAEAGKEEGAAVNTLNLEQPEKVGDGEEKVADEEEIEEDNGEIEIEAPTAIELHGTADVRLEAGRIELESIDNAIDATGTSGLYMQARGLENGDMQSATVQTRVEEMEVEDEEESGVIQLSSTEGSALVTDGKADATLVADRKVLMESFASTVETGGNSSVEIAVGTGVGDGIEAPDSGDADIQSDNGFGVDVSGSASVVIVANGDCTVDGASGEVNNDSKKGTVSICE